MINTGRRIITIELNGDYVYYDEDRKDKIPVSEIIKLLADVQSKYPDKNVFVDIYEYYNYDCDEDRKVFMEFYYERLETDEEYNERIHILKRQKN